MINLSRFYDPRLNAHHPTALGKALEAKGLTMEYTNQNNENTHGTDCFIPRGRLRAYFDTWEEGRILREAFLDSLPTAPTDKLSGATTIKMNDCDSPHFLKDFYRDPTTFHKYKQDWWLHFCPGSSYTLYSYCGDYGRVSFKYKGDFDPSILLYHMCELEIVYRPHHSPHENVTIKPILDTMW